MDIKIHAIHFDATTQLEAHINKKVKKLEKLNDSIISVDVFLKVVKPETSQNKEAEIKVIVPNAEFFASKVTDTFEESVDTALFALEKQILKSKEKQR
ncbi:MAG: ribosome-associated translation inhibitor RaiA [Paludibacteraceae bacterium]|jgi:putative sigma-54 modulation protein|nr:ribosome-associated translation inhibitor RaiA [Bacteroidales bacterium]MBQ5778869.1 ribosome-associated translation inhibitor RaiA [Paludibacteraceae bacterium]